MNQMPKLKVVLYLKNNWRKGKENDTPNEIFKKKKKQINQPIEQTLVRVNGGRKDQAVIIFYSSFLFVLFFLI